MTDLLFARMSHVHSYHDHKETMAHAAILVTLALAAGVLSATPWPPQWVPTLRISSKAVAFVAVVALWLLIHIYMRWQLRKRRVAAVYYAAILKVLRTWATNPPSAKELTPWGEPPPRVGKFDVFLDLMFWPGSDLTSDEEITGYPTQLVKILRETKTGATTGEVIVTAGSLLIGVLIIVRGLIG
jgi:small-conductance mechanosensitive channel